MDFPKPYQKYNGKVKVLSGRIPFGLCICDHITPGRDSCSNFKVIS